MKDNLLTQDTSKSNTHNPAMWKLLLCIKKRKTYFGKYWKRYIYFQNRTKRTVKTFDKVCHLHYDWYIHFSWPASVLFISCPQNPLFQAHLHAGYAPFGQDASVNKYCGGYSWRSKMMWNRSRSPEFWPWVRQWVKDVCNAIDCPSNNLHSQATVWLRFSETVLKKSDSDI